MSCAGMFSVKDYGVFVNNILIVLNDGSMMCLDFHPKYDLFNFLKIRKNAINC